MYDKVDCLNCEEYEYDDPTLFNKGDPLITRQLLAGIVILRRADEAHMRPVFHLERNQRILVRRLLTAGCIRIRADI